MEYVARQRAKEAVEQALSDAALRFSADITSRPEIDEIKETAAKAAISGIDPTAILDAVLAALEQPDGHMIEKGRYAVSGITFKDGEVSEEAVAAIWADMIEACTIG